MAEVVGSHRRCPYTGRYDFDFMAFAEFLHPETKEPVAEGEEGVLVLTSLHPFQQAQPLVRYWTGDVFTRHAPPPEAGAVPASGTFRGRAHECIAAGDVVRGGMRPRLLGSADVLEVLQAVPELPQFHKNPKFQLSLARDAESPIVLVVETFPQGEGRAARLRERIRTDLAARLRDGAGNAFDLRHIDVRFVDKGEGGRGSATYYPDR
jgi:phenylacetate-coenzyme A ligase PaaK-like adenylate-forming protein